VINRLPAEELLKAVRETQAEWRSEIRRETQRPSEPDGRAWRIRLPELRDAPRAVPEPGRSSLAGI